MMDDMGGGMMDRMGGMMQAMGLLWLLALVVLVKRPTSRHRTVAGARPRGIRRG